MLSCLKHTPPLSPLTSTTIFSHLPRTERYKLALRRPDALGAVCREVSFDELFCKILQNTKPADLHGSKGVQGVLWCTFVVQRSMRQQFSVVFSG